MTKQIEQMISETFLHMADALEGKHSFLNHNIGITGVGSEHGEKTVIEGALLAAKFGIDITYIGTEKAEGIASVQVKDEAEAQQKMEQMLQHGLLQAAVTMHYAFPIGVSTVGRLITPGRGKELFLATTTGTSDSSRVCGMVKNAISGISAAKACGIENPSVGILNIEGANATEAILKQLSSAGYPIRFASSKRADGGVLMRGNDLLDASCDVLVTDPLTGNVLVKTLSAFTTGGSYESVGYGYGPGIGQNYDNIVLIISRASGAPVIANAIQYAAELVAGNVTAVAKAEYQKAEKAGLSTLLQARKESTQKTKQPQENMPLPKKEVVTAEILGIEITDIEDAALALMQNGIYAESGMGCTGPVILVSEKNLERAQHLLKEQHYLTAIE